MSTLLEQYDIIINDGANKFGLMLERENGRKLWRSYLAPTLPPRESSSDWELKYAQFPPDQELVWSEDTWVGGYGQETCGGQVARYYSSGDATDNPADCRFNGQVIPSPLRYLAIYSPVANGNFEVADPPASWTLTGAGATFARSAVQKKISSYSGLLTRSGADCAIINDITDYLRFKGAQMTFGCWVYATVANRARLVLSDNVSSAASSYHTGVAGWEFLTVTRTIDAAATYIYAVCQINTGDTSAYFDGAILVEAATCPSTPVTISDTTVGGGFNAAPAKYKEFESEWYCAAGAKIYIWNNSLNVWEFRKGFSYTITDIEVYGNATDNYLIACFDGYAKYYYSVDGSTFIQSTASDGYAKFMRMHSNAGAPDNKLWKISGEYPTTVKSNSSPINGVSWSSAYVVGDHESNFSGALVQEDMLLLFKWDALYTMDRFGKVYRYLPELDNIPSSNNFKYSFLWHNKVYITLFTWGAYELDRGLMRPISPSGAVQTILDYSSQMGAFCGDPLWLYMAGYDATLGCVLLAGAEGENVIRGNDVSIGQYWHPIVKSALLSQAQGITELQATNPRLWFGDNSTHQPCYIILPVKHSNPYLDSACRFATNSSMITPWWDAGLLEVSKGLYSVTARSQNLSAGHRTIIVYYRLDDATTWETLGTVSVSPQATLYFASGVDCKRVQLKFKLTTDDSSSAARMTGFALKGALRPAALRVFDFTVQCGDKITLKNGGKDRIGHDKLIAFLRALHKTNPITLTDRNATDWTVIVKSPTPEEVEITDEAKDNPRMGYHLLCQEVKLS